MRSERKLSGDRGNSYWGDRLRRVCVNGKREKKSGRKWAKTRGIFDNFS